MNFLAEKVNQNSTASSSLHLTADVIKMAESTCTIFGTQTPFRYEPNTVNYAPIFSETLLTQSHIPPDDRQPPSLFHRKIKQKDLLRQTWLPTLV